MNKTNTGNPQPIDAKVYLDRLLYRYSATFDIQAPYRLQDCELAAYGYFYSHTEKYVLVREANLWSSNCYEHILFYPVQRLETRHVEHAVSLIRGTMEPEFVRKGQKYPDKNHMYSYLTVAFISQAAPAPEALRQLKKYSFDKGYQFHMRGFSQARLIAACMQGEQVCTNYAASKSKVLYHEVFAEVRAGKPGYMHVSQEDAHIM